MSHANGADDASGASGAVSRPLGTGTFDSLYAQVNQAIHLAGVRREELPLIVSYLHLADAYAYEWQEARARGTARQVDLDAHAEHARYHLAQVAAIVAVSVLLTGDEKAAISSAVDQMTAQLGGQLYGRP